VTSARRDGDDYVPELGTRVDDIGLETVGIEPDGQGIPVDAQLRAGERLCAIGDVTGMRQLIHVGKCQGRVVAANILAEPREAHYEAVAGVTYTAPQAAALGATDASFSATVLMSEVSKTATYTRAHAPSLHHRHQPPEES
jgi:pyruvate/2-oxoglutarate dehydrogenase complex dihydrolipoamide dehydrogenase (E3) component